MVVWRLFNAMGDGPLLGGGGNPLDEDDGSDLGSKLNPNPLSELTIVLIHSIPLLPSIDPFLDPPSTRALFPERAAAIAPNGHAELRLSDIFSELEIDFCDPIRDLLLLCDAGRPLACGVFKDHLSANGWEKSISSRDWDSFIRLRRLFCGDR